MKHLTWIAAALIVSSLSTSAFAEPSTSENGTSSLARVAGRAWQRTKSDDGAGTTRDDPPR